MFERFTDRARRVVVLAQEESRLYHHPYIGSEHLLLGLIHEGEGIGAKVLADCPGITRESIEAVMLPSGRPEPVGHLPFTVDAKKSLEFALREALALGHNYIGTEHILLGIIREGEGLGGQILAPYMPGLREQIIERTPIAPEPKKKEPHPLQVALDAIALAAEALGEATNAIAEIYKRVGAA
jgi:ATP-dependent Clp protease ATP-binding subunit ClpC